ncbi:MAG: glyceraldehyde-3-phosphate dehydrogenase [Rhodobacteraceae bacterium]|jgi:hypothetical protein|nr:glyceraldehyde-3-phosphate dehydrogenase [Alphaproteobacteria bacterium]NNK67976.1 glyceraldehyde-3-phosphate dehydrogenase [Paracoccaceae bacterium]
METQTFIILGGLLFAAALFLVIGVFVDDADIILMRKLTDFIEWLSFWN